LIFSSDIPKNYWPNISGCISKSGNGLCINSGETDFFGSLRVADSLAINCPNVPLTLSVCSSDKHIVRFQSLSLKPALTVASNGFVGAGTSEPKHRLHVEGGTLWLDKGYAILFEQEGNLMGNATIKVETNKKTTDDDSSAEDNDSVAKSVDKSFGIAFVDGPDPGMLSIRSINSLSFSSGSVDGAATKVLVVDEKGRVGVGINPVDTIAYQSEKPASKHSAKAKLIVDEAVAREDAKPVVPTMLVVDGIIQTVKANGLGGLKFPDGKTQKTAVISIPIGSILNWWCSCGGGSCEGAFNDLDLLPKGFAVCDGSVVDDKSSPFNGKTLPNFTDDALMVRGAATPSDVTNVPGGSGSHKHVYELATGHQHNYCHTHPVTINTAPIDDSVVERCMDGSIDIVYTGHVHSASFPTGAPVILSSLNNMTDYPKYVSGGQTVTEVDTSESSQLPRYMMVLKIMRIK